MFIFFQRLLLHQFINLLFFQGWLRKGNACVELNKLNEADDSFAKALSLANSEDEKKMCNEAIQKLKKQKDMSTDQLKDQLRNVKAELYKY